MIQFDTLGQPGLGYCRRRDAPGRGRLRSRGRSNDFHNLRGNLLRGQNKIDTASRDSAVRHVRLPCRGGQLGDRDFSDAPDIALR